MDALRSPLVEALERLTADLVIEKYGDPHVAFMVLVHPDRHPAIITVSGRGAHDMAKLVCRDDDAFDEEAANERKAQGRLFGWEDFHDAAEAVSAAQAAWKGYGWRQDKSLAFGQYIDEKVRSRWQLARDATMDAAMERAAFEESHQAQCPNCSRRFTNRGLTQHQTRSPFAGCRTGTEDPPEKRPAPPHPIGCPLRACMWTGLADALADHLSTGHAGQYVVG